MSNESRVQIWACRCLHNLLALPSVQEALGAPCATPRSHLLDGAFLGASSYLIFFLGGTQFVHPQLGPGGCRTAAELHTSRWPFAASQSGLEPTLAFPSFPGERKACPRPVCSWGGEDAVASPFWAAAGGQWLLQGLGGFALGSCLSHAVWGCCQVSKPQPALFKLQVMLAPVTSICQGCKSSTSGEDFSLLCSPLLKLL